MRIVILGGGVVGVTTAYQLQRDGHEVELLERAGLPGSGASWGNAGIIAPCSAFAWSGLKSPAITLAAKLVAEEGHAFKSSLDWRLYPWLWARLRENEPSAAERNARLEFRLAEYSRRVLAEVAAAEGIDYDRNPCGILYLYRRASEFDAALERLKRLNAANRGCQPLDRAGIVAAEPSLAGAVNGFTGAILRAGDEAGDPAKFTRALAVRIGERGGWVRTGVTIAAVETDGDTVVSIKTDHGVVRADAYVLAMGSESARVARRIGVKLPIYPLKGYSLTAPVEDRERAPKISVVDGENGVAVSTFGDRLRVTGAAEFAGYDTSHRPADFEYLRNAVDQLFPHAVDYEASDMWAGLGPATPSGLPILGESRYKNLFVNAGHGHNGWATSHGSARITADLIAGRTPEIPLEGLHA